VGGPTVGETLVRAGHKLRPADKNRIQGKIQIHEYLKQHKTTGNNVTKCQSRNDLQKKLGVQLLQFNPVDRTLHFIKHRDKKYD